MHSLCRTNLEQLSGRLAAPRLESVDVRHLERCIEDIDRAARSGDAHAEAVADAAFHRGDGRNLLGTPCSCVRGERPNPS